MLHPTGVVGTIFSALKTYIRMKPRSAWKLDENPERHRHEQVSLTSPITAPLQASVQENIQPQHSVGHPDPNSLSTRKTNLYALITSAPKAFVQRETQPLHADRYTLTTRSPKHIITRKTQPLHADHSDHKSHHCTSKI